LSSAGAKYGPVTIDRFFISKTVTLLDMKVTSSRATFAQNCWMEHQMTTTGTSNRTNSSAVAHAAKRNRFRAIIVLALATTSLSPALAVIVAPTEQQILKFNGGANGSLPYGGLVSDTSGNLYGTTNKGGTGVGEVYELSPPAAAGGAWTQTVLFKFTGGARGGNPYAGLIIDTKGNLYGTTLKGGVNGNGVAFELSPPAIAGGSWTETVLHKFDGGAGGSAPYGGLLTDKSGNLFGTASAGGGVPNAGVVYELSPPAIAGGSWTQQVLYSFSGGADGSGPMSALISDAAGNLFGTTSAGGLAGGGLTANGVVFELAPPAIAGGSWTKSTLYAFAGTPDGSGPQAALVADSKGNLYGTTLNGGAGKTGSAFELSPPAVVGGAWTEKVIRSFMAGSGAFPHAAMIMDTSGALYGTTAKGGTGGKGVVFKLSPPAIAGGKWTETVLYKFLGGADGGAPYSAVLSDGKGDVFGTTTKGGINNNGVVYEILP
jgi:uncharacterized repeat protein (TIGR03803 family)